MKPLQNPYAESGLLGRDGGQDLRPYRGAFAASIGSALFASVVVAVLDIVMTLSGAEGLTGGDALRFSSVAISLYLAVGLVVGLVEGVVAGAVRATYPEGAAVVLWRRLAADRVLDRRVAGGVLAACGSGALYAVTVAAASMVLVGHTERKLIGAVLCGGVATAILPIFALATYPFYRVTRWIARIVPRLGPIPATVVLFLFTLGAASMGGLLFIMNGLDWRALPLGGPLAGGVFVLAQLAFVGLLYGPLEGLRERVPGRPVLLALGVAAALVLPAITLRGAAPSERAVALLTVESMGTKPLVAVARRLSDRDKDGYSALLGGGDCDDGRADTHPGASDAPGDGIDQNCLGGDANAAGSTPSAPTTVAAAGTTPSAVAGTPATTTPAPSTGPTAAAAKLAFDGNVVIIAVDTLRADRLGVAGYTRRGGKSLTPRMDELAKKSVWFSRAYSQAPNTPRSFPSMFTSRFPSRVQWDKEFQNYSVVLPENQTLFEALRDSGYKTMGFSSHFYFTEERGITQGFVEYDNEGAQSIKDSNTDIASPRVVPKVEKRLKDLGASKEKFALFVHLFEPHSTYVTHPEFPIQSSGVEGLEEKYDYEVAFVDQYVGRIVDAVAAAGLDKNTMIVLVSDHGEAFGAHRFAGQKMFFHGQTLYDELLRVPLMIHVPGVSPAKVDQAVAVLDLAPTVVDLVRGKLPSSFQGRSLAQAFVGEKLSPRPVFAEMLPAPSWEHSSKMMIDEEGAAKIIYRVSENLFELYDLTKDPTEQKDLAGQDKARVEGLKSRIAAWMESGTP